MKRLLLIVLLGFTQLTQAQITPVIADLGVGLPYLTDMSNNNINPNAVGMNSLLRLKLDLYNFEQTVTIPPQTFQVVIGLGTRLVLAPGFNLATAPLSNYFSWTSNLNNGQVQIIGTLISTLPADFFQNNTASFDLKAILLGGPSTITAQLAFINNNPSYNLSDPNSSNNSATLLYTVVSPLPVTYTRFAATQTGCDIRADWSLGSELNVARYEVEASKDGVSFQKVAQTIARGVPDYSATFPLTDQIKAPMIFVRIKAVDLDGTYHYSDVKTVSGTCDQKAPWKLYVYPNPVSYSKYVTLAAKEGEFNGKYRFTLVDNAGKTYRTSEQQLDHVKSFKYDFGTLASGKYIIRVQNTDGSQVSSLEFEKL